MKNHRTPLSQLFTPWILVLALVVLIAAHVAPIYYLLHHKSVSLSIVGGILGLLLLTHLGAFNRISSLLRKSPQAMKR